MIRLGPARQTPAGGIAAVLSCLGCGLGVFGGFMCMVGLILIFAMQGNHLDSEEWSDPFFDSSRRRIDESNRCSCFLVAPCCCKEPYHVTL